MTVVGAAWVAPVDSTLATIDPTSIPEGQRSPDNNPLLIVHLVAGHAEAKIRIPRVARPVNDKIVCLEIEAANTVADHNRHRACQQTAHDVHILLNCV